MRTTKKILSMILAFVLVLGLLPATAFATGAEEDVVYSDICVPFCKNTKNVAFATNVYNDINRTRHAS